MKKFLFIFLFFICNFLSAKEKDSILYVLCDSVECKLAKEILNYPENNNFIIVFVFSNIIDDSKQLYRISITELKKTDRLLSTNRYCLINQRKIPLIFDYDFKFSASDLGKIGCFGSRDENVLRTILLLDGYSITFNSSCNYVVEDGGLYKGLK